MASASRTALLALAFVLPSAFGYAAEDRPRQEAGVEFKDARSDAKRFMRYYRMIKLTPEQEKVRQEALSAIPAPCCSEYTMATCCCPCNLAKSVWGLSNHLIVRKGYDAERVRAAAREWLSFINKDGHPGKACFTGGCDRPFAKDGCGGMSEDLIR